MTDNVVNGQSIADRINDETRRIVQELTGRGVHPRLDAVMVGQPAGGVIYARSQQARCDALGIAYRLHTLPADTTQDQIIETIDRLNADPAVTGILMNLPVPDRIDAPRVQFHIDPYKDVEGVNPANIGLLFYDEPIIAPCTALAVMHILKCLRFEPRGSHAVVVGQGTITGRPISLFLQHAMATVTTCHKETRQLHLHTRQADLLVVAAGQAALIGPEHVKPGAIVIDVGINRSVNDSGESQILGDVRFDAVQPIASAITPVPGGVGPVTVAALMRSAAEAARLQHERTSGDPKSA